MRTNRPVSAMLSCAFALVATQLAHGARPPAETVLGPVDFRYSPPWWQTSICLPDDPDKALLGKEGQLLFDYGRVGERNFGILLQPDIQGGTRWLKQEMLSSRVPVVQTLREADGVEVLEEAFVAAGRPAATAAPPRLVRVEPQYVFHGWAKPVRKCSPAFADCAIDNNGKPIHFQVAVAPGAKVTVVYGFCEGRFKAPGARELVL